MRFKADSQFQQLLVVAWLTFSLGSVVLVLASWHQLSNQINAGKQTVEIRDRLNGILKLLLDMETSERGYVVTGSKDYLGEFDQARTNLPPEFDNLVNLVRDNPQVLDFVTKWRAEAQACQSWQQDVIAARVHGFDRAAAMVSTGKLKVMMDQIRAQAWQLDQFYGDQADALRQDINERFWRAKLTSLLAGAFAIGSGLLALWLAQVAWKHREHEHELAAAKVEAEHSSQEKTLFLANMSHEIRTPMNAILGFSELLQGELREPKHRQYLKSIRSSADSLLLLINDILDMSKIESGVMHLHPEPTDLREICDFVQTLFAEPAAKKGLALKCYVVESLPAALLLDRIRLRQILVNLVGNAVKFTDRGGVDVRVLFEKQQDGSQITLVVEVQDTGLGIPQDRLEAVFQPFVQAGAHREKEKLGTGLGLAIVKRLTEIMGGTVTVASVMGQGSAFHLRFPNVPISARLAASQKISAEPEADFNELRPASLLVVDDNADNRNLVAGIFAGSHHTLAFASNGEEAVDRARQLKPDLILMDIRMPGMGGDEALGAIRKIIGLELVPAIAVTASALPGDQEVAKAKFSGCVRKPFSRRDLFEELSEFLPRHVPPEAAADAGGARPVDSTPASKELLAELRRLIVEPWPAVRDSVAINESRLFAQNLAGLGRNYRCRPLEDYARKLLRDAEDYAVTDLEKHLGEFSALVEQLNGAGNQ